MASKTFKATAVATGVALALGAAPQSMAQDQELEEIVVTGSHIRRTEYEGRAPIQIVDSQAIEMIGAAQPVDIIKQLSVNSGSEFYNETNARAGVSQFNIRNLGLGSTLTLINGRRAGIAPVTSEAGTDFFDLNQLPLAMIERVEILTNGASATYGSQAVAGVANIITRKGFEGLEISGGYAASEINQWNLNMAAGAGFDRGHFNIYATYHESGRKDRTQFDWLDYRLNGSGDQTRSSFLSGTGSPGSSRRAFIDPATGEAADVAGAIQYPDPDCEAAGGVIGDPDILATNTCRYNFADQVSVISAEQRAQVFSEFNWEISDKVNYYVEASFSENQTFRNAGGQLLATGNAANGGTTILPSHPFNFYVEDPVNPAALIYVGPAAWDPTIHCTDINSAPTCQFQTATLRNIHRPLGPDVTGTALTPEIHRTLQYNRIMQGLEIELPGDWFLDASFGYAKSKITTDDPAGIRSDLYQQMVRDGAWNPFGTRLANPTLISPKDPSDTVNCFNVDAGACTAGNSDDARRAWNQRQVDTASVSETVFDIVASGELFEFGGNPISAAVGGQFRQVTYGSYPDSLSSAGEDGSQGISGSVEGRQDVVAYFAELVAPISDIGEIQLAIRNEDYGDGVSTTDPKVSAEFSLTDNISVRGSWGTSFQAPTVRQLGRATSSAFIDDPASATGVGGSFVCTDTGVTNNISVVVEGAPGLQPQDADNINLGVIFQTDNFRAAVDYFLFDYTNLIAPEAGVQAIVNGQCAGIENTGLPIIPDGRVVRDATGQVREVSSQFTNIGAVETDGIDLNADYTMEIGNSTLIFDLAATYLLSYKVDRDGDGTKEFDGAGNRNFTNSFSTMPELRANAGATWFSGNHSARLGLNYIDSYKNDQGNNRKIDSWVTLDAQYSYTFSGLIGDGDTTLTVGVNNITDEEPPGLWANFADGTPQERFLSTGVYNRGMFQRPGYDDRAGHDLRGITGYFRFKHLF